MARTVRRSKSPRETSSRSSIGRGQERRPRDGETAGEGTHPIESLQNAAGNQAVGRFLEGHGDGRNLPPVQTALHSPARQLDDQTRSAMEARLGESLGGVRIHEGRDAAAASEALAAQAFTVGNDVVLGEPASMTAGRRETLAHELAHVIQQRGPRRASADAAELESAAESAAHGAVPGTGRGVARAGATGVMRKAKEDEGAADTKTEPEEEPAADATKETGEKDGAGKEAEGAGKEAEGGGKEKKKESPGFFSRVWTGIKGAASTVWGGMKAAGRAAWGGIRKAGEAAWAGLQTVGGWMKTGAEKVWMAAKWAGRQLWDKITGVFGRITRWVTKLPARIGRLFAGLWEGLVSLKPWSLAWWKSLAKVDTWLGFLSWLGARAVDLLEILGLGEAYETLMDFVKFNTRSMTSEETARASKVFGATVQYNLVRIDERAFIGPSWTDREYTSFHTISGWGAISDDTLIHELTHVWQYETAGAIYMPQAIHAQIKRGQGAYDYGGIPNLQAKMAAGQGILAYNREEQAQIVQDFYLIKSGRPPKIGTGTAADLPLYAWFVKDVSTLTEAQLVAP